MKDSLRLWLICLHASIVGCGIVALYALWRFRIGLEQILEGMQ